MYAAKKDTAPKESGKENATRAVSDSPSFLPILPTVSRDLPVTSPIVQFYHETLVNGTGVDGGSGPGFSPSLVTRSTTRTGIPGEVQNSFEAFSGLSFDDVRVHYNSSEPAKMQALAFTHGNQVHIGPGQKTHLGHELGHVIQQKRGQVRPSVTVRRAAFDLNLDSKLEMEADSLSFQALAGKFLTPFEGLAVARSGRNNVVQAKLIIKDAVYGHTTPAAKDFFLRVVVPYLEIRGYKLHGIFSLFVKFIKPNVIYDNETEFMEEFFTYLKNQGRRVKGEKIVPVLKLFNMAEMSRPAWTSDLRERLMMRSRPVADAINIRHIIRNATLKRTLVLFEKKYGRAGIERLAEFFNINENLYEKKARGLYKALYLNPDNLWAGGATVNQAIGFLADKIEAYGNDVASGKEQYNSETYYAIIVNELQKVPGIDYLKDEILRQLFILVEEVREKLTAEELGLLIRDLGASMGFDLLDDGSVEYAEQQAILVNTEMALHRFLAGEEVDIPHILAVFLGMEDLPYNENAENAPTEIEAILEQNDDDRIEPHIGMEMEEPDINGNDSWERIFEAAPVEEQQYMYNNCLIRAIMGAYGLPHDEREIVRIRKALVLKFNLGSGELLDGYNREIVHFILTILGINYSAYPLEVYAFRSTEAFQGFVRERRYGIQGTHVARIYFYENHFDDQVPGNTPVQYVLPEAEPMEPEMPEPEMDGVDSFEFDLRLVDQDLFNIDDFDLEFFQENERGQEIFENITDPEFFEQMLIELNSNEHEFFNLEIFQQLLRELAQDRSGTNDSEMNSQDHFRSSDDWDDDSFWQ